jgi:hypothetical protein
MWIRGVAGGSFLREPALVCRGLGLNPMGLLILALHRPHVGLVGTLARSEAGTEKKGRKYERSFHGRR